MIPRRPADLVLVVALPLLMAGACGQDPRQEPAAAPASSVAPSAASGLRQSIESAIWVPSARTEPAGGAQAGSPADSADGQARASGRGGVVADALPADARPDPAMVRAQILLDRTRFSPGIVDGLGGENTRQAISAFEKAHNLPVDGELDATLFQALTSGDGGQVLTDYTITAADVAGPFIGPLPESMEALAGLETVGYATAREAMAERFHMSEELLSALNPGVDFGRAGQTLVVAATGSAELQGDVARIVVDKAENSLRAFDAEGTLLAFYPATIGSSETPSPTGTHTVRAIAPEPNYTYDPSRVTSGTGDQKFVIPPGPNNPVGAVWIDLSRDTYGIHGTPEPAQIGKTASSGCVRLTNWDAEQLASAVESGVTVEFR